MDQPNDVPPSEAVRQDDIAGNAPDPSKHYNSPEALAEDTDLDPASRDALLREWRYGLEQQLDAEAEGMGAADVTVIPDVSDMSAELGRVATAQESVAGGIQSGADAASSEISDNTHFFRKIAPKGDTHMTAQTVMNDSVRNILASPIAEKIGEAFENSPILASTAAFVTTRIALRSLTGILVLGAVAGGVLYLQRSHAAASKEAAKAVRKAKRKVARQSRNEPDAQGA